MIELLKRLRKRKLVQWTLAYAAGAWVLLQVLGLMADSFEWPRATMQIAFGVALLGFGVAIVLAWYHGERGEQNVSGAELVIIAALLGLGGAVLWRGSARAPAPPAKATVAVAPVVPIVAVAAKAPVPAKSIAVLPFENLGGNPADAYLADGIQEEILNALARLRDMKVISRTSVQEYRGRGHNIREIGERLGVRTVLEGSVRREGQSLRLTVQLIDARDDRHLLAANYDRKVNNVFGLQTAVARQVANALSATISSYERGDLDRVATNSGDAYDRYLHAAALFRRPVPGDDDGLVEPRRLLNEALAFDPDYSEAWALLSQVDIWTYFRTGDPATAAEARRALDRARALDPGLPEAQMARGLYAMYVTKDLKQAATDLREVVEKRPNSADAHMALGYALRRQGAMAEALDHLVQGWELDPLNEAAAGGPIATLLGLRRYPEAIEQAKLYTLRFPSNAFGYLARARLEGRLQGSNEPLRAAWRDHGAMFDADTRKAVEAEIAQADRRYLDAVDLLKAVPVGDPMVRGLQLGLLYAAAGEDRLARQAFEKAEQLGRSEDPERSADSRFVGLALAQSMLGEHAAAVATMEQAHTQYPEAIDGTNGPRISFVRSIILVRAGRRAEGHAEATRLLKVPFGSPTHHFITGDISWDLIPECRDPPFDALLNHPPRL